MPPSLVGSYVQIDDRRSQQEWEADRMFGEAVDGTINGCNVFSGVSGWRGELRGNDKETWEWLWRMLECERPGDLPPGTYFECRTVSHQGFKPVCTPGMTRVTGEMQITLDYALHPQEDSERNYSCTTVILYPGRNLSVSWDTQLHEMLSPAEIRRREMEEMRSSQLPVGKAVTGVPRSQIRPRR